METGIQTIVSSYLYYMWNAWDKNECEKVYGHAYLHFWNKWCDFAKKDVYSAAEKFYAELTECNREPLVKRANEVYHGSKRKMEFSPLVCHQCASSDILAKAWAAPNYNNGFVKYCNERLDTDGDCWCNKCQQYTKVSPLESLKIELDEWWNSLASSIQEKISGISQGNPEQYTSYWNSLSDNEHLKMRAEHCNLVTNTFEREDLLVDIASYVERCHLEEKYDFDSRVLTRNIISWRDEFIKVHLHTNLEENDYLLIIDEFSEQKVQEFIKELFYLI